ncbi:MAG: NAD-dependent malic enzyme [Gammaproteobacteria bacterium]|nr:NAD-dependent malic enzyme [Gammaproteobacteria bacterium]
MLDFTIKNEKTDDEYLETSMTGKSLLTIAQLNKGTAFTDEERNNFNLVGKLPVQVETIEEQVHRSYLQYKAYEQQLNRNIHLNYLLNTNQVLFYKLVQEHIEEMLPTIYTPIVGNVVKTFNKKFMHPRGLYIAYEQRHNIEKILDNRSNPNIRLIVTSDGEGILGIGDQGIGGMAIPVAKLMVYTAFGGINPLSTLPIMLDAGTNNEELLEDPLYLGWRHPRVSGDEYDEFIHLFITAVKKKFPHIFLHWEDFGRINARRNLVAYRNKICSFNDDIQGTGIVVVSALLAALKRNHKPLAEQRIVIFGAGTAGTGIADNILHVMQAQGMSAEDGCRCFWLLDRNGLVTECSIRISDGHQPYVRKKQDIANWKISDPKHINLLQVVQHVKPTVLIGSSAQTGAFTKTIVDEMSKHVEHPIIFPLSNPNEKSEATPADLLKWTNGKAYVATGSPFDPVEINGTTHAISQCNNYLAFPGIGLGIIACRATQLSDTMLFAASNALGEFNANLEHTLLPTIEHAREASRDVAIAVAKAAIKEGFSEVKESEVEALIDKTIWEPHYMPYKLKTDL